MRWMIITSLLSLNRRGDNGVSLWQVHGQGTTQSKHSSSSSSSSQRQQQQQNKRPRLHNPKHESTIRNILLPKFTTSSSNTPPTKNALKSGNHTKNVAIIVSSSRYWFNYRHVTNALSIYQLVKRGGITDDNIILMLADNIACNMRNPYRGQILPRGTSSEAEDLMKNVQVDYSGTDVTVDAFLRVLLGRHLPGEDRCQARNNPNQHQRSLPKLDEQTNILIYLTGHGGDNFFKFQDGEELMSHDIAYTLSQMYELRMYNEILFISDTCQAFTMADVIDVPNVYSVGSSLKGQNSYASHSDLDVGQSVIDRYSKVVKDFIDDSVTLTSHYQHSNGGNNNALKKKNGVVAGQQTPIGEVDNATTSVMERLNLYDILVRIPTNHGELGHNTHVGHTDQLSNRKMNQVPMSDFFAAPSTIRERMNNRGGGVVTTSKLWMNEWQIDNVNCNDLQQMMKTETADQKSCDRSYEYTMTKKSIVTESEMKIVANQEGLLPTDPKVLITIAGFLGCVSLASYLW
jgi:phosphatidylinositol glycan class K